MNKKEGPLLSYLEPSKPVIIVEHLHLVGREWTEDLLYGVELVNLTLTRKQGLTIT